jgi:hypothetical protein
MQHRKQQIGTDQFQSGIVYEEALDSQSLQPIHRTAWSPHIRLSSNNEFGGETAGSGYGHVAR